MLVARIAGPSSSSQPTPKPIVLRLTPHLVPSRPLMWVDPELFLARGGPGPKLHKGIMSR